MENSVFIQPAVAAQLSKDFIEARIHVDIPSHLSDEQFAANRAVRDGLTDELGMPTFVLVDPKTGEKLEETGLSGAGEGAWTELFTSFLARHRS